MAKLTPDKTRVEQGLTINEKILPWNGTVTKANRLLSNGTGRVQGVTVHNTNDLQNVNDDAEQYTRATWNNNMNDVRAHYYVDDCGAWQNLREDEVGWHASDGVGPGNETTLAVEIIMDGSGLEADIAAEENGALLCALLLHRHGLGIDQLYTHNHWMGQPDKIVQGARKNCPLYILPHWEAFKAKVQSHLTRIGKGETTPPESDPESGTEGALLEGILYIGDFTSRVETGMVELFLLRGGHSCEVVPYGEKWGVRVTALAPGKTVAQLKTALADWAGIYSCDPSEKK